MQAKESRVLLICFLFFFLSFVSWVFNPLYWSRSFRLFCFSIDSLLSFVILHRFLQLDSFFHSFFFISLLHLLITFSVEYANSVELFTQLGSTLERENRQNIPSLSSFLPVFLTRAATEARNKSTQKHGDLPLFSLFSLPPIVTSLCLLSSSFRTLLSSFAFSTDGFFFFYFKRTYDRAIVEICFGGSSREIGALLRESVSKTIIKKANKLERWRGGRCVSGAWI